MELFVFGIRISLIPNSIRYSVFRFSQYRIVFNIRYLVMSESQILFCICIWSKKSYLSLSELSSSKVFVFWSSSPILLAKAKLLIILRISSLPPSSWKFSKQKQQSSSDSDSLEWGNHTPPPLLKNVQI